MLPTTSNAHAIAEIITRLLNHFGATNEHPAVRKAMAEDWLEDLREFTQGQVEWAAREWRRTQTMRPSIAEIRRLATEAQQRDLKARALPAPAIERGLWQDEAQRQAALDDQAERYRRAAAYRRGELDAYDAIHHPDKLRQRQAAVEKHSIMSLPVSQALAKLGVSSEEAKTVGADCDPLDASLVHDAAE